MSIGSYYDKLKIKEGIQYAAPFNIIFAAAGTSTMVSSPFPNVIFPANMDEVHAVTGVDNIFGSACTICHTGLEVEFTTIMDGIGIPGPITLANTSGAKYTGGTSCATATMAGIAALVWSKYPDDDEEGIIERLKQASSNYDINAPDEGRDPNYGFGSVDVYAAVEECN